MKCIINDMEVPFSSILCRELNFGQSIKDIPLSPYQIVFSVEELQTLIEDVYDEFIEECRQDDALHGTALDSFGLSLLNYPKFRSALNEYRQLLEQIIQTYLYGDVFDRLTQGNNAENCQYVINSIQYVRIEHQFITIEGEVFPMQTRH